MQIVMLGRGIMLAVMLWPIAGFTDAGDETTQSEEETPVALTVMTPEQKRVYCLQPQHAGRNGCPPLPVAQTGGR